MRIENKKAFTLVEIMVVALIATVVFAGIYSTFVVGNRTWAYYNDAIAARKEARRALSAMVSELREAENVRVIQGPEGSVLHFNRPSEGPVSYAWRRQGDDADRIVRRSRRGERILANHISALFFQYLKDAVVIDITSGKTTTGGDVMRAVLRGKVALRSKTVLFQ